MEYPPRPEGRDRRPSRPWQDDVTTPALPKATPSRSSVRRGTPAVEPPPTRRKAPAGAVPPRTPPRGAEAGLAGRRVRPSPPTRASGRTPPAARPPHRGRASTAHAHPGKGPLLGGKIVLGLVSVLVLSLTGYAWASLQGLVKGLTLTDVIEAEDTELPADGARDILLVGLDSRTDAQGNPLPKDMLKQLRAGKDEGELNTDTLILVHIPNDGSKAVAISLPRDSYVDIPDGYGQHKINSAYARGKSVERQRLQEAGVTDPKELDLKSNQVGAKTLIATIERLTGRTIDNYASINLLGFYQITKAVGGVDVCLNNAVDDIKSHAKLPAGPQSISGADALAFVRQRHGLPRGDLDRVVRQQVFMAGLARKILSAGTLANPGKLRELMDSLKKSIVLNQGWDVIAFAQQLSGLTGGQIEFRTIPVLSLALPTPEDGMAVEVDPDQIREFFGGLSGSVQSPKEGAGGSDREANSQVTVNVMNTTGTTGLAAKVAAELTEQGFKQGLVDNSSPVAGTVVRHAPGEEDAAKRVADALAGKATLEEDPGLGKGQVTVLLGSDYPTEDVSAGDGSGGGGQPQGRPSVAHAPTQATPGTSDEPITANGVTCVN